MLSLYCCAYGFVLSMYLFYEYYYYYYYCYYCYYYYHHHHYTTTTTTTTTVHVLMGMTASGRLPQGGQEQSPYLAVGGSALNQK